MALRKLLSVEDRPADGVTPLHHPSVRPFVETSAYARHAREAVGAGLAFFPALNKKPAVKGWARLKRPPFQSTIERINERFPSADWGHIPGAADMVVVDWDDGDLSAAVALFGPATFIVKTKRGFHLYYRFCAGIPSRDLQPLGIPAQIKSRRSFVMGWGSQSSNGALYRIIRGTVDDLKRLNEFPVATLEAITGKSIGDNDDEPVTPNEITEGRRRTIFAYLRFLGARGDLTSERDALAIGRAFNEQHNSPPLDDARVAATVRQVLRYVDAGTCRPPKRARNMRTPTHAEMQALHSLNFDKKRGAAYSFADAHTLFCILKGAHGLRCARGETFAIASKAMAAERIIPDWTDPKRYRKSTQALMSVGLLNRVAGGSVVKWFDDEGNRRVTGATAAQYQFARLAKVTK
jgi:hypothetical protein